MAAEAAAPVTLEKGSRAGHIRAVEGRGGQHELRTGAPCVERRRVASRREHLPCLEPRVNLQSQQCPWCWTREASTESPWCRVRLHNS